MGQVVLSLHLVKKRRFEDKVCVPFLGKGSWPIK